MKAIEVRNLNVIRDGKLVIRNANFEINKGDYVGIIGPNGGGKTTLILTILGQIPKLSGSIKLFGKDIEEFNEWEKIAFIPQDAVNFDNNFPITVKEFVSLGRLGKNKIGRRLNKGDWEEVNKTLEFMGISDIANKRIGEISIGQKQRMFLAMALVRNPELIILDEPISNVDPITQEKFYKKLSDLNYKEGKTILVVSHDLSAVFCRMNKVICVNVDVNIAEIKENTDIQGIVRKAYGEHFYFVFHRHECKGEFEK
ncbi:MAG: ABC transporter [Candidatus Methanomethylicota archaeon]|uniref:ABC transporter n=1 Tax=Thermoproteota archaeon TaxID=2056631 RepID=A0A520KEL1_9CREN|nr:MAG: metal ABC transporter ATP-binding protein [Candidatus Verstraetearchaeota archaeon]TDA39833.1 MAG: ABC transporter [Candidatus Verstraetearchaeota archaeon]